MRVSGGVVLAVLALALVGACRLPPETIVVARVDTVYVMRSDTIRVARRDTVTRVVSDTAKWIEQTVYFATDRRATFQVVLGEQPPNDDLFGSTPLPPGQPLRYGRITVSIPRGHRPGRIERPGLYHRILNRDDDPSQFVQLTRFSPLKLQSLIVEARRAAQEKSPADRCVLLFIHGYNNSFTDAAFRTAQLAWDLGWNGPAMFYSWSSRGDVISYLIDRQNAERTVPLLREFLSSLGNATTASCIYAIAHSTGAYALGRALEGAPQATAAVKQIVLAAPDIDAVVFQQQILPAMASATRRVTLYGSNRDRALMLARMLAGGQRAGETRPQPLLDDRLDTIDASSVDMDLLGHSIAFQNQALIDDIFKLLVNGLPPDQRRLQRSTVGGRLLWRMP